MTIRIKKAKVKNMVNRFKRQGITFRLQATGYSKVIKAGKKTYVISADRHNNELFHAKRMIEDDIKASAVEFDRVSRDDIKYLDVGARLAEVEKRGKIKNVLNIDITAAYPTTLFNLGFISESTYNHLLKASKAVRLRSIGMIATRKAVFYYDRGRFSRREIIQNTRNRDIFYLVCAFVGEVINQFAAAYPHNFLYFWTDGVYLDMDGLDRVDVLSHAAKVMEFYRYQYHVHDIQDLRVRRGEDKSLIFVEFIKDGKKKPFIIPARKVDSINNRFIKHVETTQNPLKLWKPQTTETTASPA